MEASSWSTVAVQRATTIVLIASGATEVGAIRNHPLWEAAVARLLTGGDVIAFGAAAAAVATTALEGIRRVDGLKLVPFDVAIAAATDAPQSGTTIGRCASVVPIRPVLVLDGAATVRFDEGRWLVGGSEAVHARIGGRWRGFDPGQEIPLPAPAAFRTAVTSVEQHLGKPA